jgi:RNA polymerase sigma factor for flagellar operon FliA
VNQVQSSHKDGSMSDCNDVWEQYVKTGDPALRDEIILRNMPLVHHILGRLAIPTLNEETYHDLVGQGVLGLIDAVDRFEPQRGWRFSTYATLRIRGQILDALRAMDILPRGARKRVKGIERAISRLRMELCREPREDEVAAAVDLNLKAYRRALVEANCAVVSIDAALEDDGSGNTFSLQDLLCDQQARDPEETLAESELREQLSVALRQLPRRLQLLLSLYYYEGLTMREIGQVLDLSESRVSQLHGRAMEDLRTVLEPEDAVPERLSRFVPVSVLAVG